MGREARLPFSRSLAALVLASTVAGSACAPAASPTLIPPVTSSLVGRPAPSPANLGIATSAALRAALLAPLAQDISLAPGVYDAAQPFINNSGHRIRAVEAGTVVFTAGLVVGGSASARDSLIQGVTFDIVDREKTFEGAAINLWGGASGARILDVTVTGHGILAAGVLARQPDGLVVRRVQIHDATDYGVYVDANHSNKPGERPALLRDLRVTGIGRAAPGSANGTAEACLWIGATATVQGAVLRGCAWMGVWTGSASIGSFLEDISIDDTPVGVYLEHFTTGALFHGLTVGPSVHTGVVCEWADPAWGRRPACVDDVIEDSTIDSCVIGVDLGAGTTRTAVRRVTFRSQVVAAVADPAGVDNSYDFNDYSAIAESGMSVASGAVGIAAVTAARQMTCRTRLGASEDRPR